MRTTAPEQHTTSQAADQLSMFSGAGGIRESLRRAFGRFSEVISSSNKFVSWDSTPFAERFVQNPESLSQLKLDFIPDFESYIREFVLLQSVIRYPDYGQFGINNVYSETVSTLCLRHGEKLVAAGKKTDRALLEATVFSAFERWVASDAPTDEALIIVSPRGTLDEGYPGLNSKHYNCVYVFLKNESQDGKKTARFYQFRSWDTNEQLQMLLDQLQHQGTRLAVPLAATASPEHRLFSQLTLLPSAQEAARINQFQKALYQHQSDWAVNPSEIFPIISGDFLEEQVRAANAAAAAIFDCIFVSAASTTPDIRSDQAAAPEDSAPNQHIQLDQRTQLDLAITVIKEALQRWAHDSAQNYDHTTQREPYLVTEQYLIETWQALCRKKAGTSTPEEAQLVKNHLELTQIPLSSPLNQAASMLHCGIGSLVPKDLVQLQQLSLTNPNMLAAHLQQLSIGERRQLREQLAHFVRITIHGEVWYVSPEYLEKLGCTYDPIQNAVVGPCVDPNRPGTGRIPLRDDPEAYTEQEYLALLAGLAADDEPDNELIHDLPEDVQLMVLTLFQVLSPIMFRTSAGVEAALIHGDYLRPQSETTPGLARLKQELDISMRSPTAALLYTVGEIARHHQWEKIELLANEVQEVRPTLQQQTATLLTLLHPRAGASAGHSPHPALVFPDPAPQEQEELQPALAA